LTVAGLTASEITVTAVGDRLQIATSDQGGDAAVGLGGDGLGAIGLHEESLTGRNALVRLDGRDNWIEDVDHRHMRTTTLRGPDEQSVELQIRSAGQGGLDLGETLLRLDHGQEAIEQSRSGGESNAPRAALTEARAALETLVERGESDAARLLEELISEVEGWRALDRDRLQQVARRWLLHGPGS